MILISDYGWMSRIMYESTNSVGWQMVVFFGPLGLILHLWTNVFTFDLKWTQTEQEKMKNVSGWGCRCFLCIKFNLHMQEGNERDKLNNFPEENGLRKGKSRKINPPIHSFSIEGEENAHCFHPSLSSTTCQQSAALKRLGERGGRWLNEQRKAMKRFSSVDGGMRCWRRLHEVEGRKGKRVISQLLFRRYYLFLTCAPPLTHAGDTRLAPFQRPRVISPPTCSACWWWMPDKGMNAGRKEMLMGSHVTEWKKKTQNKKQKKTLFFVQSCISLSQLAVTLLLCVSAPPFHCRLGVSRRVPGVRRVRRLHHLARRSMWRLHLVSA